MTQTKSHFSIPSLIALGCAIASLFLGGFMAFLLALIAMVFGVIGFMVSFSPKVRGGIVSILSMLIAAVAIVIAIFKAIF